MVPGLALNIPTRPGLRGPGLSGAAGPGDSGIGRPPGAGFRTGDARCQSVLSADARTIERDLLRRVQRRQCSTELHAQDRLTAISQDDEAAGDERAGAP